jgi:hypothetical protein
MPVLIAIVHVGLAMVFCIAARAFDAIVKTSTLGVVPCVRRPVPVIAITILREGCGEACRGEARGMICGGCVHARYREQKKYCAPAQSSDAKQSDVHREFSFQDCRLQSYALIFSKRWYWGELTPANITIAYRFKHLFRDSVVLRGDFGLTQKCPADSPGILR